MFWGDKIEGDWTSFVWGLYISLILSKAVLLIRQYAAVAEKHSSNVDNSTLI